MTEVSVQTPVVASEPPRRRTYVQRVLADTFARPGARLGLAWVAIVAFFAVFGPFLANSHPFIIKTAAGIEFPLFRHLGTADVVLIIVALTATALWFLSRISIARRFAILVGVTVLSTIAVYPFVQAPLTVQYPYRQMDANGEIEWMIPAPIAYSPSDRLRDFARNDLLPPSWAMNEHAAERARPGYNHLLGTESNGADVLSRIIHASRIALAIGFIATSIAVVLGVIIGGVMGYFVGLADLLGMRFVEVFEAIPQFFLLLTLVAIIENRGPEMLYYMMIIIGLTGWPGYARFTRAEFLKLRRQDYVQAAIACGLPLRSILFRHMLPNGVAPVLVTASFGIASAILYESTLSFLGLGIVDQPSWGQMLSEATGAAGGFNWWMAVFPGGAIFLTVFAYNLIGEALRDAIDPHLKKSAHL